VSLQDVVAAFERVQIVAESERRGYVHREGGELVADL
jgi:hypothetical protein